MDRTAQMEERIAHLIRAQEDLSDVVARHGAEIDRLTRRVEMLMQREAEREADGPTAADPNPKPPHWETRARPSPMARVAATPRRVPF